MSEPEKIYDGDNIIAIILRKDFESEGAKFFTPIEFSQQLGLLIHREGKIIKPHKHKYVKRDIIQTQEVLIVISGEIKVDLYSKNFTKIKTVHLSSGDTILLASGGHGIEIMENSRIIEVKQGPYAGFNDKLYLEKHDDTSK